VETFFATPHRYNSVSVPGCAHARFQGPSPYHPAKIISDAEL